MNDDESERQAWPVVQRTLRDPERDVLVPGTPEERVAMVWPLTLSAWSLSGRPLPTDRRSEMPGRLVVGKRR